MPLADVDKPRDPLAALRIQRSEPPRRSGAGRRWLKRLFVLLIVLLVAAGGLFAVSQSGLINVAEALQPRLEVRVADVSVETGRSGDATVVATGYIESRRQAKIGARGTGRIEEINVEEGTKVIKDQVIAVLEHADMDAALAAAKATQRRSEAEVAEQDVEIERTRSDLERIEALFRKNATSQQNYDNARFAHNSAVARRDSMAAAVDLAAARVREAEQMIENMFVRAPFDGTVISKDAELGESILPGGLGEGSGRGSVVTIADLEHLEVDCDVKEDYISRVRIGQPAEVAVDAVPDRRYAGKVRQVIPMGDRARATIKVKVEILDADGRLFPEMGSTVYFLPDEEVGAEVPERRLFCPSSAVVRIDDRTYVWQVDADSRLIQTEIKAGDDRDGRTEILGGLEGGERVVLRPPPELRSGQRVNVPEL
jgi:RND family efflux transporter MFP subunit